MKKLPFTDHHILSFLRLFEGSSYPLDLSLRDYFRSHKSLGAQDRRVIGDTVYGMVRWKGLLDRFSSDLMARLARFRALERGDLQGDFWEFSIPKFLFEKLCRVYGAQKGKELCRILNEPAPTTIRVNLLKTTREHLLALWKEAYSPSPCRFTATGIQFSKRFPLFSLPEFKKGFFEVQDEGSQLVAEEVRARPGDLVLDFCAGSGGKTLAIAPSMGGKGQIFLTDRRSQILGEARRRLRRAGVQNAQCLPGDHPQLLSLCGKCDRVLIDVPCSGTGTFRRNPDQKWRLKEVALPRMIEEQREIAKQAIAYVKEGGKLVYATCSLLPEENEEQVEFFLAHFPLILERPPLSLLPQSKGMDGFFAAVFRKEGALL